MIDWRLAGVVAQGVAATGPAVPAHATARFEAVAGPAEESRRLVSAYTGLEPASSLPPAEAVDRSAWIEAALGGMRTLLEPVLARTGENLGALGLPLRAIGGTLIALEAGAISGVLAQRVLGQYEFAVLAPEAPARLLFVAPNLAHAARSLEAEPDDLLRWVALHEITHALQFGGVPWLREHLAGRVQGLLAGLDVRVDPARPEPPSGSGRPARAGRGGQERRDRHLMLGEEQRGQLDEMQALMAVLEGYAEHVMDAVGAELLPALPELRAAMDRRRRDRTGLLRLFEKLIGLDMKLKQYELGKKFCDAGRRRGRDRRAQPRLVGSRDDADARRAGRSGRLGRPHAGRLTGPGAGRKRASRVS
jgi:coenzyme F420 biosynthesis associated uncharacterized protein